MRTTIRQLRARLRQTDTPSRLSAIAQHWAGRASEFLFRTPPLFSAREIFERLRPWVRLLLLTPRGFRLAIFRRANGQCPTARRQLGEIIQVELGEPAR